VQQASAPFFSLMQCRQLLGADQLARQPCSTCGQCPQHLIISVWVTQQRLWKTMTKLQPFGVAWHAALDAADVAGIACALTSCCSVAAQLRLLPTEWRHSGSSLISLLRQLAARSGCRLSILASCRTSFDGTQLDCCGAVTLKQLSRFDSCAACVVSPSL
jgi:hypothetical protein